MKTKEVLEAVLALLCTYIYILKTCMYIYIYVHVCDVCVCACLCVYLLYALLYVHTPIFHPCCHASLFETGR